MEASKKHDVNKCRVVIFYTISFQWWRLYQVLIALSAITTNYLHNATHIGWEWKEVVGEYQHPIFNEIDDF